MKNTSKKICALVACLFSFTYASYGAITFDFDYTYDDGNWFSDPVDGKGAARTAALEEAATDLGNLLTDNLLAIEPGPYNFNTFAPFTNHAGNNTWDPVFFDPRNTAVNIIGDDINGHRDLNVPANTLKVFVGAYDLPGSTLGVGGFGGFSSSGQGVAGGGLTDSWGNIVKGRGQAGALLSAGNETDFGPWGGSITFDTGVLPGTWTQEQTLLGELSIFTQLLYELAHVLGFGTADSWDNLVAGASFTGANSTISNGGVNPTLDPGLGHWLNTTESPTLAGAIAQEAAMDPSITSGVRKLFTNLDAMGLDDIGWDVTVTPVPEPSFYVALVGLGLAGYGVARRRLS